MPVHVSPPFWLSWWFVTFSALLVLGILYTGYTIRIRQIRKEERLKTDFHKKLAEVEMNALRAQMNPHFLFNSLNAIKYYVVKEKPEKAAEYLDNFARLIRLILHNSREQRIPLGQELETLKLYVEMERLRFDEQFDFEMCLDSALDAEYIMLPPLLLQPYAENAIWHGLLHRDQKGKLTVRAYRKHNSIFLEVEDNGIGRHKAQQLKSKSAQQKKSMGMQLTKARIDMNQALSNTPTTVEIIDLQDEFGHACGTRVVIKMQHPDIVSN
jgi:sensor histidine kinase YesM